MVPRLEWPLWAPVQHGWGGAAGVYLARSTAQTSGPWAFLWPREELLDTRLMMAIHRHQVTLLAAQLGACWAFSAILKKYTMPELWLSAADAH